MERFAAGNPARELDGVLPLVLWAIVPDCAAPNNDQQNQHKETSQ